MKTRSTLLFCALLLLVATVVSAAPAASGSTMTSAATGLPFCVADLAAAPQFSLPGQSPSPRTGVPCGLCSGTPCQGVATGTLCMLGGGRGSGHCQPFTEDVCSDGTWACTCGNGPLI